MKEQQHESRAQVIRISFVIGLVSKWYWNRLWSTHAFAFKMHANEMGIIKNLMVAIKICSLASRSSNGECVVFLVAVCGFRRYERIFLVWLCEYMFFHVKKRTFSVFGTDKRFCSVSNMQVKWQAYDKCQHFVKYGPNRSSTPQLHTNTTLGRVICMNLWNIHF